MVYEEEPGKLLVNLVNLVNLVTVVRPSAGK